MDETLCPAYCANWQAQPWEPLSGQDIQDVLTDRSLQYDTAWQDFRALGRSLYNAGRDSWGYRAARRSALLHVAVVESAGV